MMASMLSQLIGRLKRPAPPGKPTIRTQASAGLHRPAVTPTPREAQVARPAPIACASLKGRMETRGRTNILIPESDETEELLTLCDDSPAQRMSDGFDPYNTGDFTKQDLWGKGPRR